MERSRIPKAPRGRGDRSHGFFPSESGRNEQIDYSSSSRFQRPGIPRESDIRGNGSRYDSPRRHDTSRDRSERSESSHRHHGNGSDARAGPSHSRGSHDYKRRRNSSENGRYFIIQTSQKSTMD